MRTAANEGTAAALSPDGRWLAYTSGRDWPARDLGAALSRARRAGPGSRPTAEPSPGGRGMAACCITSTGGPCWGRGRDVERVRVRGVRAPLRRRLPHLRAAAVVRRRRRWQLRDDEVRERAVDLGPPELAWDAPLPGRRPLTGPQAHSVLRPKRGRPSGWAAARLRSDELLIGSFAGSLRRRELDRVPRWRGDHVTVKQVVDDFARYLYPPRSRLPRCCTAPLRTAPGFEPVLDSTENPRNPVFVGKTSGLCGSERVRKRLVEHETAGSTAGSGQSDRRSRSRAPDVVRPSPTSTPDQFTRPWTVPAPSATRQSLRRQASAPRCRSGSSDSSCRRTAATDSAAAWPNARSPPRRADRCASNRQMLPAFELRRCCFAEASLVLNTRRLTLGRSVVSTLGARRPAAR